MSERESNGFPIGAFLAYSKHAVRERESTNRYEREREREN